MVEKLSATAAGSVHEFHGLFVSHCSTDNELPFHLSVTINERWLNQQAVSQAHVGWRRSVRTGTVKTDEMPVVSPLMKSS